MQRLAAALCLLTALLSPSIHAQSPAAPTTQHAFSYCSVIDTAGHKVWASPVFEYEYVPANGGQFSRTQEMATEFHEVVGSMGGAGDKSCGLGDSRASVEAARNEARSILTKRFMGLVRTHKWMDVSWTPRPWSPATAVAKPAFVTKYFYCYATDVDQRKTVAALVFEMNVDNSNPMAVYTQATEYGEAFTREVAAAHGVAQANPQCYFKDTRAEAEKALHDYRKLFSGFNLRFTDVSWRPTAETIAAMPGGAAAVAPAAPAAPVAPVAPMTSTSKSEAAPAQGGLGIQIGEITPTLALALGMDGARGALVLEVLKGRPAEAAGIRPMDVVLSVNQQVVKQYSDLPVMLGGLAPGTSVSLRFWRERAEHEVQVQSAGSPAIVATPTAAVSPPTTEPAMATVAMPAAGPKKYCHAFIQFVSAPGGAHTRVWENRDSDGSEASMQATLTAFATYMHQQQPDVWHEFPQKPKPCGVDSGFCYNSAVRHFGGKSQIVGQFCKSTREAAEAEWTRLTQDSPGMEIVAWPESP